MAATRLLLPFTGSLNALALDYAVKLAEQRQATLVLLALIHVKPERAARLDHIQQAQDFLELACRKAQRQGVVVEQARISTSDVTRSIEAVAGEMNCEAVLLFLHSTGEALLSSSEIQALMDHAAYNAHVVLLPSRRERRLPLHVPLLKRSGSEAEPVTGTYILVRPAGEKVSPSWRVLGGDERA